MTAPRWTRWLVTRVAPHGRVDELLGEVEEVYRRQRASRGWLGMQLSGARGTLELVSALVREQARRRGVWNESPSSNGSMSALDLKLGLRMLVKHPALSIVSVLGMSVAIAIGAAGFEGLSSAMDPTLPLSGGERIVSVLNNTRNPGNPERQILHDFVLWRERVKSLRELSAFADETRNLVMPSGAVELVRVAEMTASGFGVARVQPLLGRALLPEDELPNAPAVMVIGYDAWQRHLKGDRAVLGRQLQLGREHRTVVGIMPEGYRFPVNHGYWVPLRIAAAPPPVGEGPTIHVFGRLAEGATLETARAEFQTIGRGLAATYPQTHELLRPEVLPYTHPFMEVDSRGMAWGFRALQLGLGLLLLVVAVNVAILIYARTAARAPEILVRTALGASRGRVVSMLFIEALVLSSIAAVLGLAMSASGLALIRDMATRGSDFALPFWFDFDLSSGAVLYTAGLTILAGAVVGVLPALKVTGRSMHDGLKQLSARGAQMHLGRTWTTLIIVQVAIAVAALPYALAVSGKSIQRGMARSEYATDQLLRASLSFEREADFAERGPELLRRIEADPAFAGVTYANSFPGDEGFGRIELQGSEQPILVRVAKVEPDYFDALGVRLVQGRGFVGSDTVGGAQAVIVDPVFLRQVLGGADPIGRRFRQLFPPAADNGEPWVRGPWLEIVGVAPGFAVRRDLEAPSPTIYVPATFSFSYSIALSVRVAPTHTPIAVMDQLRQIATAVDPDFTLHGLITETEFERQAQRAIISIAIVTGAATASVLLLSAAGIYAMISFTVVRRRREIGIRMALGASSWNVLRGIFARAGSQLGTGALAGLALGTALDRLVSDGPLFGSGVKILPLVAATFIVLGLLSALGPARRGLAVQPTETLKEE